MGPPGLNAKQISISYGFVHMPTVAFYVNVNITIFSVQRGGQI